MKKIILCVLVFLFISGIFFSEGRQRIKIAAMEWPPYTSANMKEGQGFLADVSIEVLTRAGYDVDVTFFPWARAKLLTQNGTYQGLLGANITDERKKWYDFPDSLYNDQVALVCLKDKRVSSSFIQNAQEIAPCSIAIINGSVLVDVFNQVPGIKVEPITSFDQSIQMTLFSRVDYCIESVPFISDYLKNKMPEAKSKVKVIKFRESSGVYLALSKLTPDSQKVVTDFNAALKTVRADGTYEKILDAYGISE